jgi:predicted site-specific integrase-resolvase
MNSNAEQTSSHLTEDHPWLEDGFLTTPEAADVLGSGVIPLDVRTWCRKGLIRYVKEPFSGKYLVCEADVRAIAKECGGAVSTVAVARIMLRRRVLGKESWADKKKPHRGLS